MRKSRGLYEVKLNGKRIATFIDCITAIDYARSLTGYAEVNRPATQETYAQFDSGVATPEFGHLNPKPSDKKRHRGPWDRGSADSYYRAPFRPHYYEGSQRVEEKDMTPEQIAEYREGYRSDTEGEKDFG